MKIFSALLDLLFPPKCIFCHRLLIQDEESICPACAASLPIMEKAEREQHLRGISLCTSAFRYEGDVRSSLHRYKFGGCAFYAEKYAQIMAKLFDAEELSCDVISYVPLSRQRRRKRGYDQAQLLAEQLSRLTGIPCVCTLQKLRNTAAQSGTKDKARRYANIHGAYRADHTEVFSGREILLVDDIVTTGATLEECAAVLLASGAKAVKAATAARTNIRPASSPPADRRQHDNL